MPETENVRQHSLRGRHVAVTRPVGQAAHLAELLSRHGAVPVLYPVLEIIDPQDPAALHAAAAKLDHFDLAIFISPNAVERALPTILALRPWPAHLRVATVGRSSEQALAGFGLHDVIAPSVRFDSESLLALPQLRSLHGACVVIFRGEGGRELLAETLIARGATVEYVECYRRVMPRHNPSPLLEMWAEGKLDAVTLTSSEGLRNFLQMIGKLGRTWLRKTPVFVPHRRIEEACREAKLQCVITTGPGDDGLIEGLVQYFGDDGNTQPS